MDPVVPRARTIVVENGRILQVGNGRDATDFWSQNAKEMNLKGRTVVPGFIDPHCHLLAYAEGFMTLNLRPQNNVRSISDIQERIRQLSCNLKEGTWIRGKGYNEFYLTEKRHPVRLDLDVAAARHPIKLTHRSGRAHVLNTLALQLAGISKETADPAEGLIDRDFETGEPTGLLYGMNDYLAERIPRIDREEMEQGIKLANRELCSLGITSIHDASPRNDSERWKTFQQWMDQSLLRLSVTMILGKEGFKEYQRQTFPPPSEKDQLRLGGVKIIVHETTGQLSPTQEDLNEMVLTIHKSGLQAVMHAIEGKALEAACNAVEYALRRAPKTDHRHRIEHCSVCPPPLASRLASLGVRVVTHPSFLYHNGERYLRLVPEPNLRHLYPLATLMKHGVNVAASSDSPLVPANPLLGMYSAVSRKAKNGELILPQEGISAMEALHMHTDYAAEISFEEASKGSIMPGKLADLVVLSGDPTELPVDEIKDIEVEMTILNGEIVWDKGNCEL